MQQRDDEVEITLYEPDEVGESSTQLPSNFVEVGSVARDDVHVYLRQSAYLAIEKLAKENKSKEVGSILLGSSAEQMGALHVVISDCIEAKYTDASASSLTFTHETWEYVYAEQQRLHPTKKIVGWQHTHPNYGIFLSSYDTFIQENFFNLPFQVAYVVDPVQNIRGFFQWKDGKIRPLDGFYVYDDVGVPIEIDQAKPKPAGDPIKRYKGLTIASLCVTLAIAIALLALWIAAQKYSKTMQELTDRNEQLQRTVDAQAGDIEALKNQSDTRASGTVTFEQYTVQKGDTLISICKAKGLDYAAYRKVILAINGIRDADLITEGRIILLPIPPIAQK